MGAEDARSKVKIAPRKKVPRQNQLFHWYSPPSEPVNVVGTLPGGQVSRFIEGPTPAVIPDLTALLACSALTSTRHPRKYRISATRHPRSTVGGIGHPFASTQMLIEVPPHTGSLNREGGQWAPLPLFPKGLLQMPYV